MTEDENPLRSMSDAVTQAALETRVRRNRHAQGKGELQVIEGGKPPEKREPPMPKVPALPAMPRDVAQLVQDFAFPPPGVMPPFDRVTEKAKELCQQAHPVARRRVRPATFDDWYALLWRCGFTTANAPIGAKALRAATAGMLEAMQYVPVIALVRGAAEVMRLEFFPKPHAMEQVLASHIRAAMAEERAIGQIAHAKVAKTYWEPPTPEQAAANKARIQAIRADIRRRESEDREAAMQRLRPGERGDMTVEERQAAAELRQEAMHVRILRAEIAQLKGQLQWPEDRKKISGFDAGAARMAIEAKKERLRFYNRKHPDTPGFRLMDLPELRRERQ